MYGYSCIFGSRGLCFSHVCVCSRGLGGISPSCHWSCPWGSLVTGPAGGGGDSPVTGFVRGGVVLSLVLARGKGDTPALDRDTSPFKTGQGPPGQKMGYTPHPPPPGLATHSSCSHATGLPCFPFTPYRHDCFLLCGFFWFCILYLISQMNILKKSHGGWVVPMLAEGGRQYLPWWWGGGVGTSPIHWKAGIPLSWKVEPLRSAAR